VTCGLTKIIYYAGARLLRGNEEPYFGIEREEKAERDYE
jgi:hypothetical protein